MKNFVLFCFLFILFGCKKETNNSVFLSNKIQLVGNIELNDEINKFILEFMNSLKNPDCLYELYIDKQTEGDYFLTLFTEPNSQNYFLNRFPVNYAIVDGKYVFIYSGLEDFIKKEKFKPEVKTNKINNTDDFESTTISMTITKDTVYILKDIGFPFSDYRFSPIIVFEAPDQ